MWIHHTYRVTECSQKVHTKQPGINRIAQERLCVLWMTYTYTNVGRGYPNYIILLLNQPVYIRGVARTQLGYATGIHVGMQL